MDRPKINNINVIYHNEIPSFMKGFLTSSPMERIKDVGMNCGLEYTSFPFFQGLPRYSRYAHSLGAALIVYHFTHSEKESLAALFHDIATPTFAHSIDFMKGDYLLQEATETRTELFISRSEEIVHLLKELGLSVDDVKDYHIYPIADNDTPRLSSDRLEYTLGNLLGYGFRDLEDLKRYYDDLEVGINEEGAAELCFRSEELALNFALDALRMSKVYVCDEDRYAMQMLSELLKDACERKVIDQEDLYTDESSVIRKFNDDPISNRRWMDFTSLHELIDDEGVPKDRRRVIHAKKRYINPLVSGKGRVYDLEGGFRDELDAFLNQSQDGWLFGH